MRTVRASIAVALLLSAVVVVAQEAPAVDRTDPKAVAEAYVQACHDGEVETALSLLEPDERVREWLRGWARDFAGDGGPGGQGLTLGEAVLEMQFTPLAFAIDRTFATATQEGDRAQVTFHANWPTEQQIVLARQEDGTWAVNLIDSIKATTQREFSWIAEEMGLDEPAQGEVATTAPGLPASGPSADVLRRLWSAAAEYAGEHDGRLPAAERWVDELELYLLDRSLLKNPDAPDLRFGYAMNLEAGGAALWDQGGQMAGALLFVECDGGERNAVTTPEGVAQLKSPREDGTLHCVTTDGQVWALKAGLTFAQSLEEAAKNVAELVAEVDPDQEPWEQYSTCTQHLNTLVQAIRRYARQNGGMLPAAETWQDDIAVFVLDARPGMGQGQEADPGDLFTCPAAPDLQFAYAINAEIAGKSAFDFTNHDTIVLVFESDLNRPNAAGSPDRDTVRGRHHLPDREPLSLVGYLGGQVSEATWPDELQ